MYVNELSDWKRAVIGAWPSLFTQCIVLKGQKQGFFQWHGILKRHPMHVKCRYLTIQYFRKPFRKTLEKDLSKARKQVIDLPDV